jgi:hypothetical protein
MDNKDLIYDLLKILGYMEVEKGDGTTTWIWDDALEKPVRIN